MCSGDGGGRNDGMGWNDRLQTWMDGLLLLRALCTCYGIIAGEKRLSDIRKRVCSIDEKKVLYS